MHGTEKALEVYDGIKEEKTEIMALNSIKPGIMSPKESQIDDKCLNLVGIGILISNTPAFMVKVIIPCME